MRRSSILFVALALLLGACGGDTADPEPQSEGTQEAALEDLNIGMSDYAFQVEGAASEGPVTIAFTSEGLHMTAIGRLEDGKTIEDVRKVIAKGISGPPPPWFDDTPYDLSIMSTGPTSRVHTELEEGTYALLCFIPGPKGKSHVELGMSGTFDVGPAAANVAPITDPGVPVPVTITDKKVEAPQEVAAGAVTLEVTNDGKAKSDFNFLQLGKGKKLSDIDKWFRGGGKGELPASFYGGTHEIVPGGSYRLTVVVEPGTYTIVSTAKGKDLETELVVT